MAAAIASRGVPTTGVDVNPSPVEAMRQKRAPVFEPGLAEMIASCDGFLGATQDVETAVRDSEITFVVVPTPSNSNGAFSLEYVGSAMQAVGSALHAKTGYHLVVLTSTVLPGSTEYFVKPVLEEASGKRCGAGFGLCYSPEFIALGSVLRDFLNPDFLLVGECDSGAGGRLVEFYRDTLRFAAPVARMSAINAELAKIALNTYVTAKITFANMLAEICECLPGGDVDAVTGALGLDQRIGAKYLKGALGYGGPCFPRDNQALACFMDQIGLSADLPHIVDHANRRQASRIAALVSRITSGKPQRVAVLGLAYKPDTNVVEESQGIAIAQELVREGHDVAVFDPVALDAAKRVLGDSVHYASSLADCVRGAAAIVLATNWPEFRHLLHQIGNSVPRPVIVDGWRMFRSSAGVDRMSYHAVGMGGANRETRERLSQFVESLAGALPSSAKKQAVASSLGSSR
jgi:UDPglucose 6-dehydrogenase